MTVDKITEYLTAGGLFNPEHMEHNKVRDLLIECRGELERLQDIITRMSRIYMHLNAEKYPGTYFIHDCLGETDHNGMPEKLMVVPAYGVDFSYIYQRTDKTTGPEW